MNLSSLGWNQHFAEAFKPYAADGFLPARVSLEHKHAYELLSPLGMIPAACTGRLLHTSCSRAELPAVGDWIVMRLRTSGTHSLPRPENGADIHAVLPRRTCFSRRAAGVADVQQILAANVDTVFIVTGLDQDFSPRRIERYLTLAHQSGAEPVVLLNKIDLQNKLASIEAQIAEIAKGVPVVSLSALKGEGLPQIAPWLQFGRTVALLGSSGVGKSTLINQLLGSMRQKIGAISVAVDKGCHTTTHRELIPLESGALVIDTPGLRELQLWDVDEDALEETFTDIATLAQHCRFRDCTHQSEPGCAILSALEEGSLEETRWQGYRKLQREQAFAARRADPVLARKERDRWKKIHQGLRLRERIERDCE